MKHRYAQIIIHSFLWVGDVFTRNCYILFQEPTMLEVFDATVREGAKRCNGRVFSTAFTLNPISKCARQAWTKRWRVSLRRSVCLVERIEARPLYTMLWNLTMNPCCHRLLGGQCELVARLGIRNGRAGNGHNSETRNPKLRFTHKSECLSSSG